MDRPSTVERRHNPSLRAFFDTGYALIEPFLDPAGGWGGQSLEHLAYRVLRENFPELPPEDVHTLVVAAHRVYIQRNPHSSQHLKHPEEFPR